MIPGPAPVSDDAALRAALSHLRITSPDGVPFEAALAERNGWALDFAERVADEYCGFLYLATTAGFEVTPSQAVDQAWHLHLEWPHYRETLCREILGRDLEHRPGTGEPEDEARCARQYAETLALYERVFGKPPPDNIWPDPDAPEMEDVKEEEEEEENLVRTLSHRVALGSLVASLPALAFGFPGAGFFLAGSALVIFLVGQAAAGSGLSAQNRKSGSSCGTGGCGGGESGSSGDDCGASCGGGGCGGGCGGGGGD